MSHRARARSLRSQPRRLACARTLAAITPGSPPPEFSASRTYLRGRPFPVSVENTTSAELSARSRLHACAIVSPLRSAIPSARRRRALSPTAFFRASTTWWSAELAGSRLEIPSRVERVVPRRAVLRLRPRGGACHVGRARRSLSSGRKASRRGMTRMPFEAIIADRARPGSRLEPAAQDLPFLPDRNARRAVACANAVSHHARRPRARRPIPRASGQRALVTCLGEA